jgi:5-methylcytosine-specific restriction endonuclease McrA
MTCLIAPYSYFFKFWHCGRRTRFRFVMNEMIHDRDGNKCLNCGVKSDMVQKHHVRPLREFSNLRYDLNNIVTLCSDCHRLAHDIKNYEEQYARYITNKIR